MKNCRHDGSQLFKANIYDVKKHKEMGHVWVCPECEENSIGYGDPDEYNGIPLDERNKEAWK